MAVEEREYVVGGDGDGDGLQRGAAVAVGNRDVVLLRQLLAGLQLFRGAVVHLEAPANRAATLSLHDALPICEAAEIAGGLGREGRRMGVGGVDIGEGDAAAGVEIAGNEADVL